MTMRTEITADDEAEVLKHVERLQEALRFVLAAFLRLEAAEGRQRSGLYTAAHGTAELLGEQLAELIRTDPDRGRPWAARTLTHLRAFVQDSTTPTATTRH